MAQIASAYVVSSELISQLKTLADEEDYDELLQALRAQASVVTPEYAYSGYVLSVVSEYLSEQGIALPINPDWLGPEIFEESDVSWLLCADYGQASKLLGRMNAITSSDDELHRYYEKFNGGGHPEAGAMMAAGIAFFQVVLRQVTTAGQWLIVVIG